MKLLDFGLAKAYSGETEHPGENSSESPTLSHQATASGVILGTAAYMAPEQARGKTVDRRADIWAFGVLLLEMLTGRRTFTGETVTDVLAAIVTREADLDGVPEETPSAVRQLLRRCLDRDPRQRLRDIGEARVLLEAPPAPAEQETPTKTHRRGIPGLTLLAGGAALLILGGLSGYLAGRQAPRDPTGNLAVRQITFRRGQVTSARFAPDGQTVIYAGTFDGGPLEVYSVRVDTRQSRPLGLTGAQVLGVSSSGEIALSLGHRYTRGFESTGTLARVPLGTAAPREVLEGVEAADWGPDGQTLAVVRAVEGRRLLEFPVGTVLHETGGWISNPRVSPDGRLVAFFDHPNRGDNVGAITVVDREGQTRVVTAQSHSGLAWSPSGEELFHFGEVGGSEVSENTLFASDLSGRSRMVFQTLGDVSLEDVAADGRILLTNRMWQRELVGRAPGAPTERNLSWGDWSFPTYLSPDGETVLIEEQRMITDDGYVLFMRPTDGAPPVRLGDGRTYSLSPDGRWVLAVRQRGDSTEMWLLPSGAGQARRLFSLDAVPSAAGFLPDGERIVVASRVAEGGTQLFVHGLSGGPPRAISPPGVTVGLRRLLLPDGLHALASSPDGELTLYPIDEGDPLVVPGSTPADVPVGWQGAQRTLLVQHPSRPPARIEGIDIETGERQPWKELTPPDPAGVSVIGPIHVSADGRSYVYSYRRVLDRLTVIDRLR